MMRYALAMVTKAQPMRLGAALRAPMRWLLALCLLGLGAMHGELLLRRLADNSIVEPSVLARWMGAAALLLVARLWRRKTGRSMLTGRSALVFALFAALLHVGPAAGFADAPSVALPVELLVLGLAGLLLAAATAAAAKPRGMPARGLPRDAQRCRAPRALPFGQPFSPRPPPLR
jgi:hypothetical protein